MGSPFVSRVYRPRVELSTNLARAWGMYKAPPNSNIFISLHAIQQLCSNSNIASGRNRPVVTTCPACAGLRESDARDAVIPRYGEPHEVCCGVGVVVGTSGSRLARFLMGARSACASGSERPGGLPIRRAGSVHWDCSEPWRDTKPTYG